MLNNFFKKRTIQSTMCLTARVAIGYAMEKSRGKTWHIMNASHCCGKQTIRKWPSLPDHQPQHARPSLTSAMSPQSDQTYIPWLSTTLLFSAKITICGPLVNKNIRNSPNSPGLIDIVVKLSNQDAQSIPWNSHGILSKIKLIARHLILSRFCRNQDVIQHAWPRGNCLYATLGGWNDFFGAFCTVLLARESL